MCKNLIYIYTYNLFFEQDLYIYNLRTTCLQKNPGDFSQLFHDQARLLLPACSGSSCCHSVTVRSGVAIGRLVRQHILAIQAPSSAIYIYRVRGRATWAPEAPAEAPVPCRNCSKKKKRALKKPSLVSISPCWLVLIVM